MEIRDVGFLPENEIHERSEGSSPYQMGHDPKKYALDKILSMAEVASSLKPFAEAQLGLSLKDKDSAVRYWAVMGLFMRGPGPVWKDRDALQQALNDPAPAVRIAAAEALGTHGDAKDVQAAVPVLLELGNPGKNDVHVCLQALNALDALGTKAASALPAIEKWPKEVKKSSDPRSNYGVPRLIDSILKQLDKAPKQP
jgi:uncharacterized sulfatase